MKGAAWLIRLAVIRQGSDLGERLCQSFLHMRVWTEVSEAATIV